MYFLLIFLHFLAVATTLHFKISIAIIDIFNPPEIKCVPKDNS